MKILYVITQGEQGGAQRYVLELAKAFGGEIVTGGEGGSLVYEAEDAGIPVHQLFHLRRAINPLDDLPALWDLVQVIKKVKPDIIHLNSSKAGFLGSLLKPLTNSIIVYTAHGFVFNEPLSKPLQNFYIIAERFASRYRDYIIAVSQKDRETALEHHIISPEKIFTVYNGIGEINFLNRNSARQYLGLPLDKTIIGSIANLYQTKGIDVLIQAAALLPAQQLEHLQFTIIGQGPQQHTYERLIAKLNLQNSFKLIGHRELASHYLKAFDIFTLPSRKEGFPFALLEALQAGLPIIATNVGGMPEALGDSGLLVEPQNPAALAEAISRLLLNSDSAALLQSYSQKSLNRSTYFTLDRLITETQKIYDMAISQ